MDLLELIESTRTVKGGLEPFLVFLPDRGSRERLADLVTRRVVPLRRLRANGWRDEIAVGRGPRSDIKVATMGVSSLHALFRPLGGGRFALVDNASTNGTFVDGERLFPGEARELRQGSVLRFGSRRFLYGSLELCRSLRAFVERSLQSAGVFVSDPEAETMALPDEEPEESVVAR